MMIESALKMNSTAAAYVRFEMNATGARKSFHRAIFLEAARGLLGRKYCLEKFLIDM